MTVTADDRKRVVLPAANPGEQFDLQISDEGNFVLRRLGSSPGSANIRIEKRQGFSVGVSDQAINEQALREALADFP